MTSCTTPSHADNIQFQFDHVSTPIISEEHVKITQNDSVQPMFSPGLSPIELQDAETGDPQGKIDHFNFPFPVQSAKQYKKVNTTTRQQQTTAQKNHNQQQQQQPKQKQQQLIESQNHNENFSFELDLSLSIKSESSHENSSRFETSKCSNILNRTMNVTLLLKDIGLGHYSEKFAKEGIDLDKFTKLNVNELKGLGLQSDEDCKAIIDLVYELNSTPVLKV